HQQWLASRAGDPVLAYLGGIVVYGQRRVPQRTRAGQLSSGARDLPVPARKHLIEPGIAKWLDRYSAVLTDFGGGNHHPQQGVKALAEFLRCGVAECRSENDTAGREQNEHPDQSGGNKPE